VIIVLPNFPEGSFFAPEVRMVMKWTYETICRGDTSLISQLQRAGVNVAEYISFHQLRAWGYLDQVRVAICRPTTRPWQAPDALRRRTHAHAHQGPVSNQVYVHCKCMIVDDVWAVIGSANINDRSMLGVRDSEVAIITRDKAPADGKMNGRNARVSSFAQSLRISLWREHLGLLGVRHCPLIHPTLSLRCAVI
jgi:phospholipase D1/2